MHYARLCQRYGGALRMTEGKPKAQTIATEKYQKKAGYIPKSFKLKKDIVDEFSEACKKAGTSQAATITRLMKEFIEENNNN